MLENNKYVAKNKPIVLEPVKTNMVNARPIVKGFGLWRIQIFNKQNAAAAALVLGLENNERVRYQPVLSKILRGFIGNNTKNSSRQNIAIDTGTTNRTFTLNTKPWRPGERRLYGWFIHHNNSPRKKTISHDAPKQFKYKGTFQIYWVWSRTIHSPFGGECIVLGLIFG